MSVGIRADHRGMTKFTGLDDPGFKSVAGQLRQWTQQLMREIAPSPSVSSASPDATLGIVGLSHPTPLQIAANQYSPPQWVAAGRAPQNEQMDHQYHLMLMKSDVNAAMAYAARFAGRG